jgi:drug/metabolite transporter (DMT)-like permease
MKSNYVKGLIFSVLSVLAFASNEVLGTLGLRSGASIPTIITFRTLIGVVLFGLTILFWNKELFKFDRRDIWRLLLPACFLFAEIYSFWVGLKYLKEISVMLSLYYLCPIWATIVYALITKKKPKKNIYLGLALGILGVLLVSQYIPNFVFRFSILGGVAMLGAGFLWAMYFITSQFILKKYHILTVLFYTFLFILGGSLLLQSPAVTVSQLTPETLKYVAVLGVSTSYLAYLFLILAIKFNKAVKTNILDIMSGVASVTLAFIVLGQALTFLQILGLGSVLAVTYVLKGKNE